MRPSSRHFFLLRAVIYQFVFLLFANPLADRRTSLRIVGTGFVIEKIPEMQLKKINAMGGNEC
jgi:hypothetical protein